MRDRWREEPAPSRLDPARYDRVEILGRHDRACTSGLSSYVDPASGDTVLTACYLAERGSCCAQGCRHCPWEPQ